MPWQLIVPLVLAGLLGAACLPGPAARPAPQPTPAATTPAVPEAVTPTAQPNPLIKLARRDLAQRLGVAPQAIRVISAEPREWSSTALGCPEPGNVYAQVITPGYRIVLGHAGKEYVYHTDRREHVILCTRPAS